MEIFSTEEFAARRRGIQDDAIEFLKPFVRRALLNERWQTLLNASRTLFNEVLTEDSGNSVNDDDREWRRLSNKIEAALDKTKGTDETTVDRIATWLSTLIPNAAASVAAQYDDGELVMVWVTMHDKNVREPHQDADGQARPIGDKFDVGGYEMTMPGDPTVPIELWINCRCVLRPDLIANFAYSGTKEALVATTEFRDVSTEERKKGADSGAAMPDGSYPIANCQDLRNAIQAIGRATDPAKVKSHIRKRKSALGCPDVELPQDWANEGDSMSETPPETPDEPVEDVPGEDLAAVPFYSVLAPEGIKSGDGRRFTEGSLRVRPLPLPLTWQKTSAEGHDGNVTVSKIEQVVRVGNEMRAVGHFLATAEADEVVGLIAEFGRFGISIDADDATFELDEDDETVDFTSARIASACIVPIPAFAEAWIALGEAPEGFLDDGSAVEEIGAPEEKPALVASATDLFKDLAPGKTEDGPGWLTHPVDTDRLRDYWVRGPGAAKINWGVAGDFNRCRLAVAEYIKPQYLNGYCANRHYDALGFWPGRPVAGDTTAFAAEALDVDGPPAEALHLIASGYPKAPAQWFTDPGLSSLTPLTITDEGRVYGHLAQWGVCHIGIQNVCTEAPHSASGYAYFRTGEVLTTNGSVAVGNITIGGGHAGHRLRARPAAAHYDSTSAVAADVACGDDAHGIWVAGWVRPGTPDEMVAALRASGGLSGDWRDVHGNGELELVAALAVNVPGFPVPRVAASVSNGIQTSLVAAGMVLRDDEPKHDALDVAALARAVVEHLAATQRRKDKMAALAARVGV